MSAMPPESFSPAAPPRPAGLAEHWAAIHEAAAVVAALAGQAGPPLDGPARAFPVAIVQASGQRLAVARRGVEDLSAILETGLRALLSLHGRGTGIRAAAATLYGEFSAARDSLVALAPPERRPLA